MKWISTKEQEPPYNVPLLIWKNQSLIVAFYMITEAFPGCDCTDCYEVYLDEKEHFIPEKYYLNYLTKKTIPTSEVTYWCNIPRLPDGAIE